LKIAYWVLIAASCLAAAGQLLFKLGADTRESVGEMLNVQIFGGLLCYGLGTLGWIFALSKLPLTVVYPFTALTFVLVYAAAVFLLGEHVGIRSGLGIGCVLVGLYLLTGQSVS
jgi:drug/metabolite transporter (DMT)-like permease